MSPGSYVVTLQARGVTSSTTVEVRGDPLLELTDAEYRASEEFQLRAAALSRRVTEAMRGAAGNDQATASLRALAREVMMFTRSYGDAGRFYDGNFDAPNPSDLARLAELEAAVGRVLGGG